MSGVPFVAAERKANSAEREQLRQQREPGLSPTARAARLPGEPVYAPLMNGGYAVAVTGFSGPLSPKDWERIRRNDSIHTDYQMRLQRLADRAKLRADSIRADSLSRRPDRFNYPEAR